MANLLNFRVADNPARATSPDLCQHHMLQARGAEPIAAAGKVTNVRVGGTEVLYASEA